VLAGEFTVVNTHLVKDLQALGLWTAAIKTKIVAGNGSVQHIPEIPEDIRCLYRTVWEISQKTLLNLAADRGAFIDQSQSLNVHMAAPSIGKLSSMHFYGWKLGLKTGMYYLRTRPAADAIKFTISPDAVKASNEAVLASKQAKRETDSADGLGAIACSIDNPEACVSCGS
jgi:ribonucleoside-diphosphate reductase subunit M1